MGALRFAFFSALGLGTLFSLSTLGAMWLTQPGATAMALFLASLTAIPWAMILLWLDRHEKEPMALLSIAFLWGACVATSISAPVNSVFQALATALTGDAALAGYATAAMSAPFIEELSKGAGVLGIFLVFRDEFDDVLDGLLYGALVGLGFAWFENITYYLQVAEGGLSAMIELTWLRGVAHGVAGHATFTGLTGVGLGIARTRRTDLGWLAVPGFLGLAIFAHFSWNAFAGAIVGTVANVEGSTTIGGFAAVLILSTPFVLLLSTVVGLSWSHQRKMITRYLASEPRGLLPDRALDRLLPARQRAKTDAAILRAHGFRAWRVHQALNHAMIELAWARWHHDRGAHAHDPPDHDPRVRYWRAQVFRLRRMES